MSNVDWDERARRGVGYQSVIDPGDTSGLKNDLIDCIQWEHVRRWALRRGSVLDFGCGTGRFAQRIISLGAGYTGVDASVEMIDAARRLHCDTSAAFHQVPQLPLPFEDQSFDGCLTVGVLQCLQSADGAELRRTVAELARVTATGGELLMIEQASESGGFSGSVSATATEHHYCSALEADFAIRSTERVRLGSLSRASSWYLRLGRFMPFRHGLQRILARHEAKVAQQADQEAMRSQIYYDLAIVAVRRAGA
jgi:SAM-dependent methyltransferase